MRGLLTWPCILFLIAIQLSIVQARKSDSGEKAGKKSYHVLVVSLCYRGHLNPYAAFVRRLTLEGHRVTVFSTDSCKELMYDLMPGIEAYHEKVVMTKIDIVTNLIDLIQMFDVLLIQNGTTHAYRALDDFLQSSTQHFDIMVSDFLTTGSFLAARKHGLLAASIWLSPIIPTMAMLPPFFDYAEFPQQIPNEKPTWGAFLGGVIFNGVLDITLSTPVWNTINGIHDKNGWDPAPYNYGRHPWAYIHANTILIAQGNEPITAPPGAKWENVYPMGFIPDDIIYPPLTQEISEWLEHPNKKPIVFVSLGTLTELDKHTMAQLIADMKQQQKYRFLWAVKPSDLKSLKIDKKGFKSDNLYIGSYLPQGNILQHPQVKMFVTHCGSNSIQDSVYGMTPMLTFPGFGDQLIASNIVVGLGIARLLPKFDYSSMDVLIEQMLQEPNYSQMVTTLKGCRDKQIALGGYRKGVQILEDIIEGRIKVNTSIAPEDLFGFPVAQQRTCLALICLTVAACCVALLVIVIKVLICVGRSLLSKNKPKKSVKTE